jgi:hypothetical protein
VLQYISVDFHGPVIKQSNRTWRHPIFCSLVRATLYFVANLLIHHETSILSCILNFSFHFASNFYLPALNGSILPVAPMRLQRSAIFPCDTHGGKTLIYFVPQLYRLPNTQFCCWNSIYSFHLTDLLWPLFRSEIVPVLPFSIW